MAHYILEEIITTRCKVINYIPYGMLRRQKYALQISKYPIDYQWINIYFINLGLTYRERMVKAAASHIFLNMEIVMLNS